MARRHGRQDFYIPGEGVIAPNHDASNPRPPGAVEEVRKFRFSRMFKDKAAIKPASSGLLGKLAAAMVLDAGKNDTGNSAVPAGFTYLGQFVDHDLTLDKTATALGSDVTVEQLIQGRSPTLDLDCLYGLGPEREPQFYSDTARLKTGTTMGSDFPGGNPVAKIDLEGFDVPRVGVGPDRRARRQAQIPDHRNDENLVVAQTHAAFIRFHNRVVDDLAGKGRSSSLFEEARSTVVKHYQWMLRRDFLPRIIDEQVLDDVFANGRRFFEVAPRAAKVTATEYHPIQCGDDHASMPIEFSVGAYRLGHSMVRQSYEWNNVFQTGGPGPAGSLLLLFNFSGTSGTLSPINPPADNPTDPNVGTFERLPTNWVADWRRLFDFKDAKNQELVAPKDKFNFARTINTLLVDPLKLLPIAAFGGLDGGKFSEAEQRNLAFRNLERGRMVLLPSGQQMAAFLEAAPLSSAQILEGAAGATIDGLTNDEKAELISNTPLWFYILREAETGAKGRVGGKEVQIGGKGKLGPVGSRIVAEVFHRAMETSSDSIVREPLWRPSLPRLEDGNFTMVDLLLFAFENKAQLLAPL